MDYQVIRSRRRTLALEVTRDGRVLVRSPQSATETEVVWFVEAHREWLRRALARQAERRQRHPEPTEEEAAELRRKAQAILPGKVAQYAAKMGVTPTAVHITSARTRFGSCSGRNSLSFSWRLMQYPEAAVDYVVVHELAHIRHHNHSAAFYAFVEEILPDYRERAALLRT